MRGLRQTLVAAFGAVQLVACSGDSFGGGSATQDGGLGAGGTSSGGGGGKGGIGGGVGGANGGGGVVGAGGVGANAAAGGTSGAAGMAGSGSGAMGGASGTLGAAGRAGVGGAIGAAGALGTAGTGGGCTPACPFGLTCCSGKCVNTTNDINHCGACGNRCTGTRPFCNGQQCSTPPCEGVGCIGMKFCCGTACCDEGALCCEVQGPGPSSGPRCYAPVDGTCPIGCPLCQ